MGNESRPKIGDTRELSLVVTQQHVIDFADQRMPAVLPLLDANESKAPGS